MRTITTRRGVSITVDGDVLAVIEGLFESLWHDADSSYEQVVQEIAHLLTQLSEAECRQYLAEALFLTYTRYENERLERAMRRLDAPEA